MSDQNPSNVELVMKRPDGTVVMSQGALAGVRTKLLGGQASRSGVVRVTHAAPGPAAYFDPAYAVQRAPDPSLVVKPVEVVKPEIVTEAFTKNSPTSADPWADIQITVDEDEIVEAEVISSTEDKSNAELNAMSELTPEELFAELLERDLRDFGLTEQEFNALRLSKRQLWKLNEQVIGRTANKPTVAQAIRAILEKANKDASNYARVMAAIKRVREQQQ
jgi:hypothetical protein